MELLAPLPTIKCAYLSTMDICDVAGIIDQIRMINAKQNVGIPDENIVNAYQQNMNSISSRLNEQISAGDYDENTQKLFVLGERHAMAGLCYEQLKPLASKLNSDLWAIVDKMQNMHDATFQPLFKLFSPKQKPHTESNEKIDDAPKSNQEHSEKDTQVEQHDISNQMSIVANIPISTINTNSLKVTTNSTFANIPKPEYNTNAKLEECSLKVEENKQKPKNEETIPIISVQNVNDKAPISYKESQDLIIEHMPAINIINAENTEINQIQSPDSNEEHKSEKENTMIENNTMIQNEEKTEEIKKDEIVELQDNAKPILDEKPQYNTLQVNDEELIKPNDLPIQAQSRNNGQKHNTELQKNYSSTIESKKQIRKNCPIRLLNLKQLKDIIYDIYIQKEKYDEQCIANKLPKETMEQYMYSYLNQRYGLKPLIIEWASNIIDSIKKHSKYDAEVMVFGKMLKNECDEGFRFMIAEAKRAIEDILESQLRKKYKYKREVAIRQLLASIKEGVIEEWLWKGVIEEMYNESHATQLEALINEYILTIKEDEIQEETHTRERPGNQQKPIVEIPFSVFQKLLLDFQLRTHESYLLKFIQLFKAIDTDTDGIINESQFRELLGQSTCAFEEQDISEMLNYLDPYNHQKITFSDCIALLTQQQTIEKINTIS